MKIKKRIYVAMVGTIRRLRRQNTNLTCSQMQANHKNWLLVKQAKEQRKLINDQRDMIKRLRGELEVVKGELFGRGLRIKSLEFANEDLNEKLNFIRGFK